MKLRLQRSPILFAAPAVALLSSFLAQPAQAQPASDPAMVERIRADVQALTRFPSRVPGTKGNTDAAQFVLERFKQIGLEDAKLEPFIVTAPVTKEATLTVGSRVLKVLPMYPNHIMPSSTPRKGLTGPMVYGGVGRPKDYNGKKIEGAIVVLDFNSGLNWITAADLGARAVIFLEPNATSRGEAERKFASLPINIPRFYAPRAVADAIRAAGDTQTVTLRSRVEWDRVTSYNVVGTLKGSVSGEMKNGDTLVINSYYDSMSIAPDLAPGAEAAGNCAALLETARFFQSSGRKPKYSLRFVANGAHHIALAGTRNYVAQHFTDRDGVGDKAVKAKIASYRGFIGLDLTSRTDTVGLFAKAWFYNQMTAANESILLNQFSNFAKTINALAATEAKRLKVRSDEFYVDGVTGAKGRSWRSFLPSSVALDSEAATMAGKAGISFATANDARLLQDTPFDTIDKMNIPNLARQVGTINLLLAGSLNDIDTKNKALPDSSTLSAIFGFSVGKSVYRDIRGKATMLPSTPIPDGSMPIPPESKPAANETPEAKKKRLASRIAQLELLKDAQAVGYLMDRTTSSKSYSGVRGAFIERAEFSKYDKKTETMPVPQFIFIGPRAKDPKGGPPVVNEMEAYSLNGDNRIIFAPDQGTERSRFSPLFPTPSANLAPTNKDLGQFKIDAISLSFRCRATALYDTLDQRYFSVLTEMSVLDAQSDAAPTEFGFLKASGGTEIEPVAMIFSKPGARFKLIMAAGLLGKRLVVLNTEPVDGKFKNQIEPEGVGVLVAGVDVDDVQRNKDEAAGIAVPETDEEVDAVVHVSYQVARDLWILNQQRIRQLKFFGINNQRVDQLHEMAGGASSDRKTAPKPEFRYVVEDPLTKKKTESVPAIQQAATALEEFKYDTFYMEARRAFGLESRAYPDVEATAQDVLKGIIFYLALLLPFSFFMERLLIGSSDVRKQIAGTSVAFLIVFTCIRFVHPAFELALTPFIILLAFIILALTVVVTVFLSSKFEQEIKRLKQGVHFADVGRLSAISAALGLGIANMRRRPMRTALTCVTLVLLTFTVLSFTSVTANITNFARPYGKTPPQYAGLMVRQPDWSGLQEAAVSSMTNEFSLRFGNVAPRAWYLSKEQGEALQLRVSNPEDTNKFFNAPALMGVTPQEVEIGSPITKTLVAGKWFDSDRLDVCLLSTWMLSPQTVAEETDEDKANAGEASTERTELPLGLTKENAIGAKVQVAGQIFEVIGIFDDQKFRNARDLDGEGFTPVDYQKNASKMAGASATEANKKGTEVEVQTYEHTDANALLVLPYETVLTMGGTTRSLAAGFKNTTDPTKELNDLMQRAALGIFGSTETSPGKFEARLYSSVEGTSYEGFASLLIPILIAALIIANTMLGSVFERTREISIYSAVGLAPVHVAALFIAEAMVYAVLGSISGYLIAQVVAKIITANELMGGITLNYSSSSAILSTLIVMATVLLSTIYPAMAASRMSQPDIDRRWRMSEPFGDVWRFQFPFTVSGQQPVGVAQFLYDFFSAHTDTSVGKFYTDRVIFNGLPLSEAVTLLNSLPPDAAAAFAARQAAGTPEEVATNQPVVMKLEDIAAAPNTQVYRLAMRTWLAPFDMGVSQDSEILLIPSKERGLYELQLKLVRQSGEIAAWKRVNRQFLGDLRKQLLLWRTIKREDQQEYILRGRAHVGGEVVPHEVPGAVPGTTVLPAN